MAFSRLLYMLGGCDDYSYRTSRLRDFNNDDLFPNRPAQPKLVATAPSPVQTADCDTSLVVPYSTIYIGCEFSVL